MRMGTTAPQPTVTICVPTYKRPQLLYELLVSIDQQNIDDIILSVLVVDNDPNRAAAPAVADARHDCSIEIVCVTCDPPNISRARNTAIGASTGEYILFVDDDERATPGWVQSLVDTVRRYDCSGVLGPVVPDYVGNPPRWLCTSGLADRRRFATGTQVSDLRELRTGNLLLRRSALEGMTPVFDPAFGLSGGEDVDFFERMLARGHRFIWCDDAVVKESVPPERQTLSYYLRRTTMSGANASRRDPFLSVGSLKSLVAVVAYAVALPVVSLVYWPAGIRLLLKLVAHSAKLVAYLGVRPQSRPA